MLIYSLVCDCPAACTDVSGHKNSPGDIPPVEVCPAHEHSYFEHESLAKLLGWKSDSWKQPHQRNRSKAHPPLRVFNLTHIHPRMNVPCTSDIVSREATRSSTRRVFDMGEYYLSIMRSKRYTHACGLRNRIARETPIMVWRKKKIQARVTLIAPRGIGRFLVRSTFASIS